MKPWPTLQRRLSTVQEDATTRINTARHTARMSQPLQCYGVLWCAFCLLASVIALRDVRPAWRDELRFLTVPWKVAVFAPAILFTSFAGRFSDDETWDVVSGGGMAVLTYLTSGWSIGTLFNTLSGRRRPSHFVVAIALWLFSSSWFYDGYLLLRDGAYTSRWWSNLFISPVIYLAAGILLNLEVRGAGVGLGFTRAKWPVVESLRVNAAMVACGVPLMLIAAYGLVAFVHWPAR